MQPEAQPVAGEAGQSQPVAGEAGLIKPAAGEAEEPRPESSAKAQAPAAAKAAPKRRAARRPSKPDAVLAAAVDAARDGVLQIADPEQVGPHLGVAPEAERLVTHRFAADVPGYGGWQWFATLARAPRSKDATLCEVGLLPSEDSLLAPPWVPWAERVRPEDTPAEAPESGDAPESAADQPEPGAPLQASPALESTQRENAGSD